MPDTIEEIIEVIWRDHTEDKHITKVNTMFEAHQLIDKMKKEYPDLTFTTVTRFNIKN